MANAALAVFTVAAQTAAHRFFCASDIQLRAAADSLRFSSYRCDRPFRLTLRLAPTTSTEPATDIGDLAFQPFQHRIRSLAHQ